jgi:hypothetical protein
VLDKAPQLSTGELMLPPREAAKERSREAKWAAMFGSDMATGKEFRHYRKGHIDKYEGRILKGIPDACRSRAWYLILDSKFEETAKRPAFESLIARAVPDSDRVIRADIRKTLPLVSMFTQNDISDSLYRIIRAYVNYDADLGYCQGMAFSAALLLAYMPEAKAFWSYWHLMKGTRHMFRNYFLNDFTNLKRMNVVWEALLKKRFPKVAQNFAKYKVEPMHYTPPWFLTGFQSMPFPPLLRLRLFDRQAAIGSRAILSFALAIIETEKDTLSKGNMDAIMPILQKPYLQPSFQDWRLVLKKGDKLFLSRKAYADALKAVGLREIL